MDQSPPSGWRQMFERQRQERPTGGLGTRPSAPPQHAGYDDGLDPVQLGTAPLSPQAITDHAAAALADDPQEYRPWILQRGARATMMLNLRRFDLKSGLWSGWAMAYPSLIAAEYVGDGLVSLDFGTRHFVLEGRGLGELVDHLQGGMVQCVQEFAPAVWPSQPNGRIVAHIRLIAQQEG